MADERARPVAWTGGGYADTPEDLEAQADARDEERRAREEFLAQRRLARAKRWSARANPTTGLIVGRFLPVHAGHVHLLEVARQLTPELTVLVRVGARDEVPAERRVEWLRELAPTARVALLEGLDVDESRREVFVDRAEERVLALCPERPGALYGADAVHQLLAQRLEVAYRPLDRGAVPTSATAIRANVFAQWRFLPAPVRAFYARRVAIVGPEGVGKSALARSLATHFATVQVPEAARALAAMNLGMLSPAQLEEAASLQRASERALLREANRVLFCDSTLQAIAVTAQRLFHRAPAWVAASAQRERYDLTLLLSDRLPFRGDPQHNDPVGREQTTRALREALLAQGEPVLELDEPLPELLFERARKAIEVLLSDLQPLPRRERAA